jgi:hypothetical protein
MNRIFMKLLMALAMAIDIFPGLRRSEGKFGGHKTHTGTIGVVEVFDDEWPTAAVEAKDGDDGGDFAEKQPEILC